MTEWAVGFERFAIWAVAIGSGLALTLALGVVVERIVIAAYQAELRRTKRKSEPVMARALDGDESAIHQLAARRRGDRQRIAELLIEPLIANRDPRRIAATATVVRQLSLAATVDRLLESRLWWRRTLALRSVGLLQATNRTPAVVAALGDPHPDVRDAALDALADMHDPAALPAIVVHLHDASFRRGRRAAAIASLGPRCEAFVLDLSHVDRENRTNYARALAICGTARSRSTLCDWTRDSRVDVCAAAFEALAHVGLDGPAAAVAVGALESSDMRIRAKAATALRGWTGAGDATTHLARHLDDDWVVAVPAARSLQSMPTSGLALLRARAERPDPAGTLARQMLWEIEVGL